ncbi:MAG: translation elongation factor Ts [Deltaproteobacteria bacterium]|nr:translation elongation factor Ts [Deltaproteobacteria bacterium]
MAGIDAKAIRELRERTQAGMSDCKNALAEAGGDMEKAVEIILKKGLAKSAKRAGAIAAEGEVRALVAPDERSAVVVEVNVQTDFAARSDGFKDFVRQVLDVAGRTPAGADLGTQPLGGRTVAQAALELGARLGEKVDLRRWDRIAVAAGKHGFCHSYVHMDGKIAVVLSLESESPEALGHPEVRKLADDTAMHIAATAPLALRRADVGETEVAKQREIFAAQLREEKSPKPEQFWPKIVEGKVGKWYAEVVLLEQESVVVPKNKIEALCQAAGKAAGAAVEITRFVRYERGEGLAKGG